MAKIKNKNSLFMSLLLIVLLIPTIIISLFGKTVSVNLEVESEELQTTWYYYNEEGVSTNLEMKHKYDISKNEEFVVYTEVSTEPNKFNTLWIHTLQQRVKVYVDEELIYDNSTDSTRLFGKAEQEKINLILLPDNIEGKTIKLIITCPYNRFSGYIEDIRIGYRQAFTMELFETNFPYLVFSFFLIVSSLVLLLSTFLFVKSND